MRYKQNHQTHPHGLEIFVNSISVVGFTLLSEKIITLQIQTPKIKANKLKQIQIKMNFLKVYAPTSQRRILSTT